MFFAIGIFGLSLIPIVGVGYSFTAMNFLPISPAASCGIVHIANAGLSYLISIWASVYVNSYAWYSLLILIGSALFGIAAGLMTKERKGVHASKEEAKTSIFSVSFSFDSN